MADHPDDRILPKDEEAEWVMSFVDESANDSERQEMEEIWDDTERNFLVRPWHGGYADYSNTSAPLGIIGQDPYSTNKKLHMSILKDPETHQEVMTIIASIVLRTMPEPGYTKAIRRGFEDVLRAQTVSALIEYMQALPGHVMTEIEWLLGAGIHGTGLKEVFYDYVEEPRNLRTVEVDPETGEEFSDFTQLSVPVWDDVRHEAFDPRDFFQDVGQHMIHRMQGAARRSKIVKSEALRFANDGFYEKGAVRRAIQNQMAFDAKEREDKPDRGVSSLSRARAPHPRFRPMVRYRYCGNVPYKTSDGIQRREVVVLSGETVRSKPWPRRLPWFDCKITPRPRSFWGISPAEISLRDQDLADTLKMMLCDSVVQMAHPPKVVNRGANARLDRIRRWSPRVPIEVDGDARTAISTPDYRPDIAAGFAFQQGVKQQMREGTSATDANQGFGIGTKRLSASEAVGTFQQAGIRPEFFSFVLEREYMPPPAKYSLELYQEFLEDTEDLRQRVGESNQTAVLSDILSDYDIQFVGSSLQGTKADEVDALREIVAAGANPALFPLIPWIPLLRKHFDKLGQSEIAAMVGNPELMRLHILLTTVTGQATGGANQQTGNGAEVVPRQPPSGLLPAQLLGATS